jgi:hypothetical protein
MLGYYGLVCYHVVTIQHFVAVSRTCKLNTCKSRRRGGLKVFERTLFEFLGEVTDFGREVKQLQGRTSETSEERGDVVDHFEVFVS